LDQHCGARKRNDPEQFLDTIASNRRDDPELMPPAAPRELVER
jgi:hypothetical protein